MSKSEETAEVVQMVAMGIQALLPFLTRALELKANGITVPGLEDVEASLAKLEALPDLPEGS